LQYLWSKALEILKDDHHWRRRASERTTLPSLVPLTLESVLQLVGFLIPTAQQGERGEGQTLL
jgi:hypothetical protein